MTPSLLIAMVAINTILIERCQSARDTSTSSVTREAMMTSSTLKLQGGLADEHDKSIVRVLWVTRQNSSHDDAHCCSYVNCCNASGRNATMKQGDLPNGKHQAYWANACPWSPTMWASGSMKAKTSNKNSAATRTHGTHVTHATLAVQTAQVSQLAAPGTPSPDNKTSASSDNNNSKYHIILVWFLK